MDGLRRTIRRCLGLGGILLATLLISAGLLAVFSAAGDRVVEKVMTVIAAVSLLAVLVEGSCCSSLSDWPPAARSRTRSGRFSSSPVGPARPV
ncbi:MAG: hypothetical protein CM1200mP2_09660 [Planctomycetaceae bacterium]|nr:MAG: hypothetical protein CM1200mP2_09660 [Planctomycetaceae bacterium]